MKTILIVLLSVVGIAARASVLQWTNAAGGDWSVSNNWKFHIVPGPGDTVFITNAGTYSVTITNVSTSVVVSNLTLGGPAGIQTLLVGNNSAANVTSNGVVTSSGILTITNGGAAGYWTIQPGGQFLLSGPGATFLYNLNLVNQGTVAWSGGTVETGGTIVSNGGLWQITSDSSLVLGGNSSFWTNTGTLRKTTATGTTDFGALSFINLPGGLVDAESGTLVLEGDITNFYGGSCTAEGPAEIKIFGGTWTDGGGAATGNNVFQGGTLNLRTNAISGLTLTGGNIYITGTNTFQQAGAITNLTISGATLHGTNPIAGGLTFQSGSMVDRLIVLPGGQLNLTGDGLLYGLTILNQGTVNWTGGNLNVGGTPATVVSNGGTWLATSDNNLSYGGGGFPFWTNSGTFRKSAGTGASSLSSFQFYNELSGLVEVDSGTITLPSGTTNSAGTWQLNGGSLAAFTGPLVLNGGMLDGHGTIGALIATGGTISPGLGGPGLINFTTGLTCTAGATLSIDGTGTTPGAQYDQLSVNGSVSVSNCALQVTSLPAVSLGTAFVIVTNNGLSAVSGQFAGLPANSAINVSGQEFRLLYTGGNGNDITLFRTNDPQLRTGISGAGGFHVLGTGDASTLYTVQATTNLLQWSNVGTITSDGSGRFNFNDTNAINYRYRFYRTTN